MTTATFTGHDRSVVDVLDALADDGFEIGPTQPLTRTLLDTFDGRLHTAGLRLELRRSDTLELVLTGQGPAPAHLVVTTLPRFAADLPPGPFRARLAPELGYRALLPRVSVTTNHTRAARRNREGKASVAVIANDDLVLGDDGTRDGTRDDDHDGDDATDLVAWTVEVDELIGHTKPARRVRDLLERLGLERLDGDTLDVAGTAAGIDPAGFSGSPTVPLEAAEPALDGFRAVLANLLDAIEANWRGTIDAVDPEFLHELRIAVRRTRSVLAEGRRVLPAEVRAHFGDGFRWLGQATGPTRDLDVYVLEWDRYTGPLAPDVTATLKPALEHLRARRRAEHVAVGKLLRSARSRQLVTAWRSWLDDPGGSPAGRHADHELGRVVAARVSAAQRRLVRRGRTIEPDTEAVTLHQLRKDAKRLRYLIECFGSLLTVAPRKKLVRRLKALQSNLGEHQDAHVHALELRAISHDLRREGAPTDALLAIGQLTEHLEQCSLVARDEFADRFAAYDSKPTRRALEQLLDGLAP